jgi:hypothetical protein
MRLTLEALRPGYRLTARYSGDTVQHDVLVTFDLGQGTYSVTAELFEDGKGVAKVSDPRTGDDLFIEPPQVVRSGLVDLTVRDDQIGQISGTPFSISASLKVDGAGIETCAGG